jgi:hypothetical protein
MHPSRDVTVNRRYRQPPWRHAATVTLVIGVGVALLDFPAAAEDASRPTVPGTAPGAPYKFTNRLIESNDPYLLLHAHNPVDWYPWGPEAFAKAKKENTSRSSSRSATAPAIGATLPSGRSTRIRILRN